MKEQGEETASKAGSSRVPFETSRGTVRRLTEVTHENASAEVKIINGDMRFLSKLQTEKLPISLAIFDFPYDFAHKGHASDNEPFPESDVVEVLHNLNDVSNAPLWTVAGFCSVDMIPSIRSVFRAVCNAGQELLTWCKPNVTNPGGPRLVSATKLCVLGYYSETGQREMAHYHFDPTDMRHNSQLFNAVTQKYHHPGSGVLCPYQKSYTLYSWLVNKCSLAGACVLDGFSGSGTGAIACVKANRNCLVVEINTKCAKGIATRLLTDISGTLRNAKAEREGNTRLPNLKLSGDTKSVENELMADEDTGTAAGVAESVEVVAVGPSGANLSTIEAVAGPAGVQKTASAPSAERAEPAIGSAGVQPTASVVPLRGEARPVAASVPVPSVVLGARPEAETQAASRPVPASANAQQSLLSLAMSQESSRTTAGGRKGRKRKAGGEEVSSPQAGVTIGLKANTCSRTAK
ncbi:hypothetical protein CBR_g12718 [Chara braunii]|uniref:DNA methylase N-4/N-6 domain-containing protein n=1 Tax=Chara braunii TaxID=69332 RepID=A0A388KSI3_CHABU|nr:hypothetical protein CBR_g12718 [Chara braunii]|eukprot:GBG72999.1 hypothetical protein CBR_g12718 [Chara braunii]